MGTWVDSRDEYSVAAGSEVKLPDTLQLRSVWTALDGMRSDGEPSTRFRPQGDATQTYVHLQDDTGVEYTIAVSPLLGKPKIEDGWTGPH